MLTIQEVQDLMIELIRLRSIAAVSSDTNDINRFRAHEKICMNKFQYLITMRTDRYKEFFNHEDLLQEGYVALLKAMKNYDPTKGNFVWWAHQYIKTRISRSANLHTAIRYPLKFAKLHPPHKELQLPLMIDKRPTPDNALDTSETMSAIQIAIQRLDSNQKSVIDLAFGISGDKPLPISKICKKMKISRVNYLKVMDGALTIIKNNIRL